MLNHYIPEDCYIEAFSKFLMELQCIQYSSWLVPPTAGCCHQCWASSLGGLYGILHEPSIVLMYLLILHVYMFWFLT